MNEIIKGNSLEVLQTLPGEFINCTMTSPPYWGLRDYGTEPIIWDGDADCEHEWGNSVITLKHKSGETNPGKESWFKDKGASDDKGSQFCSKCGAWKGSLGLEPTFDLYIKHLCDIFDEVKRVLRKDGTLWVNLGDSYSGNMGKKNGWTDNKLGYTKGEAIEKGVCLTNKTKFEYTLPQKCLSLIPFRFAIEMLNRGWILRNVIIWHKPNCMPSSAKDRFTVDFEYLFFFVKNKKYWFEQQFEEHSRDWTNCGGNIAGKGKHKKHNGYEEVNRNPVLPNPQGRNKRTVWTIPTKPYPEAHFAVYPAELIRTCIKAGCPRYICKKCGKAREKVFEVINRTPKKEDCSTKQYAKSTHGNEGERIDKGYTDCGCNAGFRPGVVLDPFAGSGTTLEEAIRQGKNYIGIELKDDYIKLIEKRLSKVQVSLI